MGKVIRPQAFMSPHPAVASPIRRSRRRLWDGRIVALAVTGAGFASILALAGTAFAIRAIVVLCFAALAGRARRVGVQPRAG